MPKRVLPIDEVVQAKPHRPVYRMHRYFARRPYSVFAELVRHYTEVGETILDPFCGGGVTLVEGYLQERNVLGFDINPLAVFVTRMELAEVDLDELKTAQDEVLRRFRTLNDGIFSTTCRRCGSRTPALWFEHSAIAVCERCSTSFRISDASKSGVGSWHCPACGHPNRFACCSDTDFTCTNTSYSCAKCENEEIAEASEEDSAASLVIASELGEHEGRGLWIPVDTIPDCNMQRESALFKKGILQFRQLFTPRHLLALGLLRQTIVNLRSPLEKWLLFCFSSTLRYTNRMVTRNPGWRGDRPLEWAKPGFWLPPVHLEANVAEEFSRRCEAVWRGKREYLSSLGTGRRPSQARSPSEVGVKGKLRFYVGACSATHLPVDDESVDAIITDPPYGSYVHYADLCNFWSVWLAGIDGLGGAINDKEEAVIARKRFPGAKTAADYQRILERSFTECARVLKSDGYMVLTFHNREPRAWAALMVAATQAGFELAPNGISFQEGIQSYRHTAQSRRAGSVIGDFVLSFQKPKRAIQMVMSNRATERWITTEELVSAIDRLLRKYGPLTPDKLLCHLYLDFCPVLIGRVRAAISEGNGAIERLIEDFDAICIFDSHRRQLLEEYFGYSHGEWCIREPNDKTVSTSAF